MYYYLCTYCGYEIPHKTSVCPACGHNDFKKILKTESWFRDYYHGLQDHVLLKISPEDLRPDALLQYNKEIERRGIHPVKEKTGGEKDSIKPVNWNIIIYPAIALSFIIFILLLIIITC